jgi:hypothetical protein
LRIPPRPPQIYIRRIFVLFFCGLVSVGGGGGYLFCSPEEEREKIKGNGAHNKRQPNLLMLPDSLLGGWRP